MARRLLTIVLDGHEPSVAEAMMAQGELPALAAVRARSRRWPLDHGSARRTGLAGEHLATGLSPDDARRWSAVSFDAASYEVRQRPTGRLPFTVGREIETVVFDTPYFDVKRGGRSQGLVAWGAHDPGIPPQSHPDALLEEVVERFGRYAGRQWIYGFAWPSLARCREMAERLVEGVGQRAAAAEWLLRERLPNWQLAIVSVSEMHSANEGLWHGIDPDHPLHGHPSAAAAGEGLRSVLRAVDRLVGRLAAAFPEAALAVVTPHGMGRNDGDVASMLLLPEALHRLYRGRPAWQARPDWREASLPLLGEEESWEQSINDGIRPHLPFAERLRRRPRRAADPARLPLGWMPATRYRPAWPHMGAFALPAFYDGQIRLNLQGREARGRIAAADYERERERLVAFLEACRDPLTGEPLVASFERTPGDPFARADSACDLKALWKGWPLALEHPLIGRVGPAPFRRTGGHTGGDGFLWLSGTGHAPGEAPRASTFDVVPTLLTLLGEEPGAGISGRPLVAAPAEAAE